MRYTYYFDIHIYKFRDFIFRNIVEPKYRMSLQKEALIKIIRKKIAASSRRYEDDTGRERSEILRRKVDAMVPIVRIG